MQNTESTPCGEESESHKGGEDGARGKGPTESLGRQNFAEFGALLLVHTANHVHGTQKMERTQQSTKDAASKKNKRIEEIKRNGGMERTQQSAKDAASHHARTQIFSPFWPWENFAGGRPVSIGRGRSGRGGSEGEMGREQNMRTDDVLQTTYSIHVHTCARTHKCKRAHLHTTDGRAYTIHSHTRACMQRTHMCSLTSTGTHLLPRHSWRSRRLRRRTSSAFLLSKTSSALRRPMATLVRARAAAGRRARARLDASVSRWPDLERLEELLDLSRPRRRALRSCRPAAIACARKVARE